jgi:hypothetical protein
MSFIKTTTTVAVLGFVLSGAGAFAQSSGADTGTNRSSTTAVSGQQGGMKAGGVNSATSDMSGRSSSNGPSALGGYGSDRTTKTGGNPGGRADKN